MSDTLNIVLLQTHLVWENPEANRRMFSEKIRNLPAETDLIILPEMFTTGFTMNASPFAETMQGETVKWIKNLSEEQQTAITGSVIIEEDGNFYNRLLFVRPDGGVEHYDKRHLFTLANEQSTYSQGKKKLIINYKGWKICPLVCYDLRFPVWARNVEDYDLLIYVANWPKPRIKAWDILLQARAVENMAYCAGVNRVGKDDGGYEYTGHSAMYDALGRKVSLDLNEQEGLIQITIDKAGLMEIREKLKFLEDRDSFYFP